MPFRDGTGPTGAGPLTGRGMGNCSGDAAGRGLFGGLFGRRTGLFGRWRRPVRSRRLAGRGRRWRR
ncbi:MAG: DUF5320 domain-containing protein [Anaerolineae bacterium]|jgi:hypothetical protein